MIAMCKELGFTINPDKVTKPTTTTNFLGVDIDSVTMEAKIDPSHLSETISLLKDISGHQSATKQTILSLVGKLHFVCWVCRPGRAFLCCMIEACMKAQHLHHRIKLNKESHWNIEWWLQYLPTWNGVGLFYESHLLTSMGCELFTDASDVGFCCYFQGHWCQGKFPETQFREELRSINWKELYSITVALTIWGHHFRGKRILVHCYNSSIVQIMTKVSSRSKSMMVLICSLVMLGKQNNFNLHLQHIPGVNNGIADTLSRFNNDEF